MHPNSAARTPRHRASQIEVEKLMARQTWSMANQNCLMAKQQIAFYEVKSSRAKQKLLMAKQTRLMAEQNCLMAKQKYCFMG